MSAFDETWTFEEGQGEEWISSTPDRRFVAGLYGDVTAENARMLASAPELYRALLAAEWGAENCSGTRSCPVCEGWEEAERHKPGCIVAAALKKARGE